MNLAIRPICPVDNEPLRVLISNVLIEMDSLDSEYLSNPEELADLASQYASKDSRYYVVVDTNSDTLLGGAGFARLPGSLPEEGICVLQKMYFASAIRGKGLARHLLIQLMVEARALGYRTIYLETVPELDKAIRLYERYGFQRIACPKGNTSHHSCTVFMERSLGDIATNIEPPIQNVAIL